QHVHHHPDNEHPRERLAETPPGHPEKQRHKREIRRDGERVQSREKGCLREDESEKEQPEHQSNHDFVCSAPSNSARESTAARGDVARGMGSGQVYHSDPAAERGDSRARPPISHPGHRFGLYIPETWPPRAKL